MELIHDKTKPLLAVPNREHEGGQPMPSNVFDYRPAGSVCHGEGTVDSKRPAVSRALSGTDLSGLCVTAGKRAERAGFTPAEDLIGRSVGKLTSAA